MKVIYKYTLLRTITVIEIPKGAKVLDVQEQFNDTQIWFLIDPAEVMEKRKFRAYATGEAIEGDPGIYIGTYQLGGGNYVGHIFEQPYTP